MDSSFTVCSIARDIAPSTVFARYREINYHRRLAACHFAGRSRSLADSPRQKGHATLADGSSAEKGGEGRSTACTAQVTVKSKEIRERGGGASCSIEMFSLSLSLSPSTRSLILGSPTVRMQAFDALIP